MVWTWTGSTPAAGRYIYTKHYNLYCTHHIFQTECKEERYKDKTSFAAFVSELKTAFRPRGLLLSAAVSPSKKIIDVGYDVPSIAQDLDWINVMTYDYHGHWDKKTGHVAPFYGHPDDDFSYFNMVLFTVPSNMFLI